MDRIYKYNPNASYKPNGGTYLQIMSAKEEIVKCGFWCKLPRFGHFCGVSTQ